MVRPTLGTALVAAAVSISSPAAGQAVGASAAYADDERQRQLSQWGGVGWQTSDWSSSGKSGKSDDEWNGDWSASGWDSSSGKSGKSGSSSWSSGWWASSSSSSSKSGKSKSSKSHEAWHGGWGQPGWWGLDSSGKSGKSGSSSSGWGSSSGWDSSGKSGKSGSSGWSSSGKSGKSGSGGWGVQHTWGPGPWNWGEKSGKSKSGKSKGSKSKSSKGGGYWVWTGGPSSGKSGKSGSAPGGWYGNNDDDWSKPNKPSNDDDWAGDSSKPEPEPVSAPSHPTGWKDDGWDADEYYKADIADIRRECNSLIEESQRELLPKILRLVFHDCVGPKCDGCINMDNIDNRGLKEPVEGIYPMVQKYRNKLSRADVWAICAMEAASMAVPGGHYFPLHYVGRQDCSEGDEKGYGGENHEMCSANLSNHEVLEFFATNFGMTDPQQVVVIMGIHSAAVARRENSGFGNLNREDGWVENASDYILSNKYFQSMKNFAWHLEKVKNELPVPDRYQWYFDPEGAGPIMLHSDMSLLFDFNGFMQTDKDGAEGLVMCSTHPDADFEIEGFEDIEIPSCPMAETTKEFVDLYAEDNELFIADFGPALNRILNYGYHTFD